MKKGYLTPPVLIILAMITLGVALTLYFNTNLLKNIKNEPFPPPSPTPVSTASKSPTDETADWKTYTSSDGKLSFMHPVNWKTQDCINLTHFKGSCFFSSDYLSSGIKHEDNWKEELDFPKSGIAMSVVTSNKESFGEVLRCTLVETSNVSCEELKVGGKDAVKIVKSQPSLDPEPFILDVRTTVIGQDKVYQILFTFLESNQAEGYKIANQILSTFQFID